MTATASSHHLSRTRVCVMRPMQLQVCKAALARCTTRVYVVTYAMAFRPDAWEQTDTVPCVDDVSSIFCGVYRADAHTYCILLSRTEKKRACTTAPVTACTFVSLQGCNNAIRLHLHISTYETHGCIHFYDGGS